MQINFYPESDKLEFIQAVSEYNEIWQRDGEKIVQTIEEISGLKFKTNIINAVVFDGVSYSIPLRLRFSYDYKHKEATLIHELCHRLTTDNYFYIFDYTNLAEDSHKIIDLILYDVWIKLLGEETAVESRDKEIGYGDPVYKNAWEWALSFSKKKRKEKFAEMIVKYANHPKRMPPKVK